MQQPQNEDKNRRQKETQEEKLEKIEIKGNEKARLDFVFNKLCDYGIKYYIYNNWKK